MNKINIIKGRQSSDFNISNYTLFLLTYINYNIYKIKKY
jgi:hypothetical protein